MTTLDYLGVSLAFLVLFFEDDDHPVPIIIAVSIIIIWSGGLL